MHQRRVRAQWPQCVRRERSRRPEVRDLWCASAGIRRAIRIALTTTDKENTMRALIPTVPLLACVVAACASASLPDDDVGTAELAVTQPCTTFPGDPPKVELPGPDAPVNQLNGALDQWVQNECTKCGRQSTPRDITCTFETEAKEPKWKAIQVGPVPEGADPTRQILAGTCTYVDAAGNALGSYNVPVLGPPTQPFYCRMTCDGKPDATLATATIVPPPSFAGAGQLPDGFCEKVQSELQALGADCSVEASSTWAVDYTADSQWQKDGAPFGETEEYPGAFPEYPKATKLVCQRTVQRWKRGIEEMAACTAAMNAMAPTDAEKNDRCGTAYPGSTFQYVAPASVCKLPPGGGEIGEPAPALHCAVAE
jgi:hypothetical protein